MAWIGNNVDTASLTGAPGGDLSGVDILTNVVEGNLALATQVINQPKQDVNGNLILSDSPVVGKLSFPVGSSALVYVLDTQGYQTINLTTTSALTAVTVSVSNDGAAWTNVSGVTALGAGVATVNAANASFVFPCNGRYMRFTGAAGNGSLAYTLRNAPFPGTNISSFNGAAITNLPTNLAQINGAAVAVASAQLGINLVNIGGAVTAANAGYLAIGSAASTNGQTLGTVIAPATPAITIVKAANGKLYTLNVGNPNTTAVYLKIFNAATATLGTTAAAQNFMIPASSTFSVPINDTGLYFGAGIVIAVTGGQSLTDNTAITSSCVVNYSFI